MNQTNHLADLLGGMPPEPERMKAVLLASEDAGDHLRRKVLLLADSEEPIPAWLLTPKGPPRAHPAMLCLHSTTQGSGKDLPTGRAGAEPDSPPIASRSYALHLVRRGFVTLAPDLVCDGERISEGMSPNDTSVFYRRHPDRSAAGQIVWDCMRCVDFLESMKTVDSKRIGVIGHSHGAHYGLFAAVFDQRIRGGVSNGPVVYWSGKGDPRHWARDPTPPSMLHMPRMRWYYDRNETPCAFWELIAPVAPRPWLWMDGEDDGNHEQVRDTFTEMRSVYERIGFESSLSWFSYPGGHDFPSPARSHAYQWLDRLFLPRKVEDVYEVTTPENTPCLHWDS